MLSAVDRVPNLATEWRNVDLLLSMERAAISAGIDGLNARK
jgi:hypothetical protein